MPGPYHSFFTLFNGSNSLTLCVSCMFQRGERRRANGDTRAEVWISSKEEFPICEQCACTFDDDPRLAPADSSNVPPHA